MMAFRPISWNKFSQGYLASSDSLSMQEMKTGMSNYLQEHKIKPSEEGNIALINYAFHKAGFGDRFARASLKGEKIVMLDETETVVKGYQKVLSVLKKALMSKKAEKFLTLKEAEKVLKCYNDTLSILRFECKVKVENQSVKVENAKGSSPRPKTKAEVHLLFQKALKIEHTMTSFSGHENSNIIPKNIIACELLAKKLAYRNPKNNETFTIPYEGREFTYKAKEIPLWLGSSAYGFVPVEANEIAPPILVFSGTRLSLATGGVLATVTADLDPRGVGYIAYTHGKKDIEKWLKDNPQAILTGHSLGGALARYAAIDNPDLVQGAFTFSAPGTSDLYRKKWKDLVKKKRSPFLLNFNQMEDKIPTLGHYHIGHNYQVICKIEKTLGKKNFTMHRKLHNKRIFSQEWTLLCETYPKKSLSVWMQKALTVIPFIVCFILLCLSRVIFHISNALRRSWHKTVTEKAVDEKSKTRVSVLV